ncbi:MAG: HD domain-containing protein [Dehalococcoidia bacterium]
MSAAAELMDGLRSPEPVAAIREFDRMGSLTTWIPELEAGRGFKQPEKHYYDVMQHNIAALQAFEDATGDNEHARELREVLGWLDFDDSLEREIDGLSVRNLIRLACLLHDVSKPETATIVEGELKFPRHGPTGAARMHERLPDLGFTFNQTDFVARMIRYHLRPGELIKAWPPTDHAMRRFVADLDGHVLPVMLVNLSDGWATRGPGYSHQNYRIHCGLVNYVTARAWAVSQEGEPPFVTGEDLIERFDLESGRLLGAVLTSVRQAQLAGSIRDKEQGVALAREILEDLRRRQG